MSLSSEQLLSSFRKVRQLIVPVKDSKVCSVLIPCRTYGVYAELQLLTEMQNFSDKTFQPKQVFSVTFGEGIIWLKMSLNCARTDHTLNSHIFDNWHIQFQIYNSYLQPDCVASPNLLKSDILHKQATRTDIVILLHLPIYCHPAKIHQFEIHTYQEGATLCHDNYLNVTFML